MANSVVTHNNTAESQGWSEKLLSEAKQVRDLSAIIHIVSELGEIGKYAEMGTLMTHLIEEVSPQYRNQTWQYYDNLQGVARGAILLNRGGEEYASHAIGHAHWVIDKFVELLQKPSGLGVYANQCVSNAAQTLVSLREIHGIDPHKCAEFEAAILANSGGGSILARTEKFAQLKRAMNYGDVHTAQELSGQTVRDLGLSGILWIGNKIIGAVTCGELKRDMAEALLATITAELKKSHDQRSDMWCMQAVIGEQFLSFTYQVAEAGYVDSALKLSACRAFYTTDYSDTARQIDLLANILTTEAARPRLLSELLGPDSLDFVYRNLDERMRGWVIRAVVERLSEMKHFPLACEVVQKHIDLEQRPELLVKIARDGGFIEAEQAAESLTHICAGDSHSDTGIDSRPQFAKLASCLTELSTDLGNLQLRDKWLARIDDPIERVKQLLRGAS
jgi:hypothetical protein